MMSMTGFGEGRCDGPAGTATVVIATVNHRGVSVQVRGDLRDPALEDQVRERLRVALVRGAANVHIAWEPAPGAAGDRQRLASAWRGLAELAVELGAPPPTLADAIAMSGRGSPGEGASGELVLAALGQALAHLAGSRRREGGAIAAVLADLAGRMRGILAAMVPLGEARLPRMRQRLHDTIAAASPGAVPADVLARELALEAQRIDIGEELSRLAAHLDALDRLLRRGDEPVGRELDFLAQELAREANTAGAKANDADLAGHCIALKVAIDQLKEQSANCL